MEDVMSKQQQILVRLPNDLASRFAHVVAPRQRSRFLIDLLRRELDRESAELAQAAMRLNEIEAKSPALAAETYEWASATLVDDGDADFDADVFLLQFKEAEALRHGTDAQLAALAANSDV
jgi:hypothetical protein